MRGIDLYGILGNIAIKSYLIMLEARLKKWSGGGSYNPKIKPEL